MNPVNFGEFDPKSAEELISIIESESYRLEDSNQKGSVVAAKSLANKRKEIFVAIKVDLPLSPDTDIDELLSDLYSKKYVPFDERIFDDGPVFVKPQESHDEKQATQQDVEPDMPDDMIALRAQPHNGGTVQETTEPELEKKVEAAIKPVESAELAAMRAMMKAQDEKINLLTKKLDQQQNTEAVIDKTSTANPDPNNKKRESSELFTDVPHGEAFHKSELDDKPVVVDDSEEQVDPNKSVSTDVRGIVTETSSTIRTNLMAYVNAEKNRIATEMRQLDKRHLIEPEVTARVEKQKHDTIKSLTQEIDTQKSAAITEENTRHETKLSEIDLQFANELQERVQTASDQFDTQAKQEIDSEYKKQTAQLDNILNGKKDELQMLQRELNEGLQNGFEEALKGFNTDHEQVIEEVEKQRVGDNVVTMHA